MRLQMLGSTTFDGEHVGFGNRDRQLLALLAAMAPDPVGRTVIVDELWGEAPPKNPANATQAIVSRLRKKLGPLIELTDTGYRLELDPGDIDLAVAGQLVDQARSSADLDERLARTSEALDLLQSGLEGMTPLVERWFAAVRAEAEELRAEVLVEARQFPDATRLLEGLVAAHPFRESLWGLLMRSLYGEARQAEALRAYQRASETLAEAGLTPGPELSKLEERILLQDPSLSIRRSPDSASTLPVRRTAVIGRSADVRSVQQLLFSNRVVALTGLGGIGKTTLATEIGHTQHGQAWFVDLTSISEDDEVPGAIAEAVGSTGVERAPLERIVDRLIGTDGLLIVDNCEHVIDGAARVASALIDRLPGLRVLATSREPLRIRGEQVYPVAPLATDVDGAAVELFRTRAEAVRPGATAGVELDLIVDICRTLDGVPLAIELVASAAGAMSIGELADRLLEGSPVPTVAERDRPARHTSLDAVVEWSVSQLSDLARCVFARLSIFVDGGSLAAIEDVVGFDPVPPEQIGSILAELVTRSLVGVDDDGRYRQLWLVRRVAVRHLAESESSEVGQRFVRWSAEQIRSVSGSLRHGIGQLDALRRVDAEAVNLRHALRLRTGDDDDVIDIAHGLVWSSTVRVGNDDSLRVAEARLLEMGGPPTERYVEARLGLALSDAVGERRAGHPTDELVGMAETVGSARLLGLALGIEALRQTEHVDRAMSMVRRAQTMSDDRWLDGVLHLIEANLVGYVDGVGAALAAAEGAVADLESVHDRWRTATALSILGTLRQMSGDYDAADRTHREVLAIADEMGLAYDRFLALAQIANTALFRGDRQRALDLANEAVAAASVVGGGARANALNTLGRVANAMGRWSDAQAAFDEALRLYTGLGAYAGIAHSLDNLGLVASRSGDPESGARRHLQALEINVEKGDPLSIAFSLEGLALSLAMRDHGDDAARLLGAAHSQRMGLGLPLPDGERRYVDAASALARESADDFERAYVDGERADWRVLVGEVRRP